MHDDDGYDARPKAALEEENAKNLSQKNAVRDKWLAAYRELAELTYELTRHDRRFRPVQCLLHRCDHWYQARDWKFSTGQAGRPGTQWRQSTMMTLKRRIEIVSTFLSRGRTA